MNLKEVVLVEKSIPTDTIGCHYPKQMFTCMKALAKIRDGNHDVLTNNDAKYE